MKKITSTAIIFMLLFARVCSGQLVYPDLIDYSSSVTERNFQRVYLPQQATDDPNNISLANQSTYKCIVKTSYLDGIGRPMQDVFRSGVPFNGADMVSVHTYDNTGRESHKYLPYSEITEKGKLKMQPLTQLSNQYNVLYSGDQPFSETIYDNSPLDRPLRIMKPGNSWVGSGVGINVEYKSSTTADAIPRIIVGPLVNDIPVYDGVYDDKIFYTVTTDEDGHKTSEYKDIEGKLIQKKQVNGGNELITYYVYDDFGHLRWVLPPEAMSQSASGVALTTAILGNLCFKYTYDEKERLVEKTVPGKQVEYFVYDKYDRVILTQEGNLRLCGTTPLAVSSITPSVDLYTAVAGSGAGSTTVSGITTEIGNSCSWLFTYYDVLDRVIMTGLFTPPVNCSREAMQFLVDNRTYTSSELLFYAAGDQFNAYPSSFSDATIWTVNYYDDYNNPDLSGSTFNSSFNSSLTGTAPYAEIPVACNLTKGLLTGSKTFILDPNHVLNGTPYTSQWLKTVHFYDKKTRIIQTQNDNFCTGGDILTQQYTFGGSLVSSVLHQTNPLAAGIASAPASAFTNTDIVKSNNIDYYNGTVGTLTQKINTESFRTIFYRDYDQLSRQRYKNLGGVADNYYTYNINGWLTGINETWLNTFSDNKFFKERLVYDSYVAPFPTINPPLGWVSNYLNGNISYALWQGYGTSSNIKAYVYKYDDANRLTDATFSMRNPGIGVFSYDNSDIDYSMSGVTYDKNGNLLTMNQRGVGVIGGYPTPVDMDLLTYNYIPHSNKLLGVSDAATDATTNPDFKDDVLHSTADYSYDNNGNLTTDNNKDISQITYSHLNKPEHINVIGKGTIDYIYDANGNKLQKIVNEPSATTTTDYLGSFQYKNNQLQNISNEEGRCRPNVSPTGTVNYLYDYFVKDHLQNVRSVVAADLSYGMPVDVATGGPAGHGDTYGGDNISGPISVSSGVIKYLSTNEIAVANAEEAIFNGMPFVRDDKPGSTDPRDQKAATLIGTDPDKRIGTSLMLRVMPGDKFSIGAQSYYESGSDTVAGDGGDVLGSLIQTLFGGSNFDGTALTDLPDNVKILNGALSNPDFPGIYSDIITANYDSGKPAAFLNYVVFDEQMRIIAEKSGAIQVGGDPETWNTMTLPADITIDQPGYVLSFISSLSRIKVSFDFISYTSYRGRELEEDHYYPFGLTIETASAFPDEVNNIKYNSKELQRKEFTSSTGSVSGIELYDYGARMQDPQIGRWSSVDKLAEDPTQIDLSPYAYVGNNPISKNDPDGNCPNCVTAAAGAVIGAIFGGAIEIGSQLYQSGSVNNWSAVGGSALQGGITGGVAGFTGGASLLTTAAVSAGANALGGAVNRAVQGQGTTVVNVVTDATVGGILGAGGKFVGNVVEDVTNNLSRSAKGTLGEAITEIKYGAQGYKSAGKAEVLTGGRTATGKPAKAIYDHKMTNVFTGKKLTVESKFNGSKLTPNQAAAQSNVTTPGGLIIDRTTSQGLGNSAKAATVGTGAGIDAQRNKKP